MKKKEDMSKDMNKDINGPHTGTAGSLTKIEPKGMSSNGDDGGFTLVTTGSRHNPVV